MRNAFVLFVIWCHWRAGFYRLLPWKLAFSQPVAWLTFRPKINRSLCKPAQLQTHFKDKTNQSKKLANRFSVPPVSTVLADIVEILHFPPHFIIAPVDLTSQISLTDISLGVVRVKLEPVIVKVITLKSHKPQPDQVE